MDNFFDPLNQIKQSVLVNLCYYAIVMTLNKKQKEAVERQFGPVLIIAGAGTGKTRTITCRIASLIESGIPPQDILAITFTNKAATEMKERVNEILKSKEKGGSKGDLRPFISTFHSLGVYILKNHHEEVGLRKNFSIADRERSKQILKEASRRLSIDPKSYDPKKIISFISRQKNSFFSPEDLIDKSKDPNDVKINLWKEYEKILSEESSVDFDDLLIKPLKILKSFPKIRKYYQSKWSHIHIDEYQDTNEVQCQLSDILAQKHQNICATGDLDQCIYSWRGARVDAILEFESKHPNTKTVMLEENYRSTKTILNAANNVISLNSRRKEKNLFTSNNQGEKIQYLNATTETEEAFTVANKTQDLLTEGVPASDIAVLYRTNFQSRALEEAFLTQGVSYTVVGTKFLQRQEVKDLLSYVELAKNPESISSLKRIINVPARGIGKVTLNRVLENREGELSNKAKENVASFKEILKKIKEKSDKTPPSELIKFVLKESGLDQWYKKRGEEERMENVRELVTLASRYDSQPPKEGLENFLEHVSLFNDQDSIPLQERDSVRLMTVHAAKGLEFKYVFITGMEEGLFPHNPIGDESRDEEEERRLFYVALTRARIKAFLSSAYMRTIFGTTSVQTPSRFISDIGEENIDSEEVLQEESSSGLLSGPPLPPIY